MEPAAEPVEPAAEPVEPPPDFEPPMEQVDEVVVVAEPGAELPTEPLGAGGGVGIGIGGMDAVIVTEAPDPSGPVGTGILWLRLHLWPER